MTANPYIVVLTATHPRDGSVTEHRVSVEAYTIQDAMYQAIVELNAKFGLADQQYAMKVLHIGPDTAEATKRLESFLSEVGLLRMPTTGAKA